MPRIASSLPFLLLAACASEAPIQDHTHRITTTVSITDTALMPGAVVPIPVFSTVVWRNRSTRPAEIAVTAATCGSCETVMGFTPADDGARSVAIEPGAVATLCFHQEGHFNFVAKTGAKELQGTIVVGPAR